MKIEKVSIDKLLLDPANARKHGKKNLDSIKGSLAKFGQQKPIVVNADNVIVAGNGTLQAAKELGWKEINIVRTNLKGSDITAFGIADNRTSELAEWDDDVLKELLEGLKAEDFDLSVIGFDDDEFAELTGDKGNEGLTDEDAVPEVQDEPVTKLGDVWQLGNHRLMCGDSTSKEQVEKLMDGQKADMLFTDPPYGDNHAMCEMVPVSDRKKGNSIVSNIRKIKNDDDISWLSEAANSAHRVLNDDAARFVFFKWSKWEQIKSLFSSFGEPKMVCVWDRDSQGASTFRINPVHEFCFYWGTLGDKKEVGNLRNVWRCKKELGSSDMHQTVKPVEIIEPCIRMCAAKRAVVLDLFGGSGSTLIACEKTDRKCYMMELEEKYCDVIIKRWEDFTGKKAELLSS